MKELNKRRKAAIKAAIEQPNDFENVLKVYGYVVVDQRILKALCKLMNKTLVGKKCNSKN